MPLPPYIDTDYINSYKQSQNHYGYETFTVTLQITTISKLKTGKTL